MAQTSYSFNPAIGIEGMIAEKREATIILSKLASGVVPVGKLCAPGTHSEVGMALNAVDPQSQTPGQVIALPAGIVADPISDWLWTGIPIYEASRAPYDTSLGFSSYANQDPVPVLTKGAVFVSVEGTLTSESNPVFVRVAAGGGFTVLGRFAFAAGAGLVAFPRGRWRSKSNNGLAILELW